MAVNFAPGNQYVVKAKQRRRRLYSMSVGAWVIILTVWGGLFLYVQSLESQRDQITEEIRTLDVSIQEIQNEVDRVVAFESKLEQLDGLLENHISWEPILQEIERLLPAETRLIQVRLNGSQGTVHIEGATTDVALVARTIASLESTPTRPTLFTNIDFDNSVTKVQEEAVAGGNVQTSEYHSFTLTMSFDPSVISKSL